MSPPLARLTPRLGYKLLNLASFIMKAQGIPDLHSLPPIPKFIDTVEAIDELTE